MDQEKWTEEVLTSLDQLKLVSPRKELYDEILLKSEVKEQATISLYWMAGIAASFLLLISLNLSFMSQDFTTNQSSDSEILMLQFDNSESNQLYQE